jgi:hypothetical protein
VVGADYQSRASLPEFREQVSDIPDSYSDTIDGTEVALFGNVSSMLY